MSDFEPSRSSMTHEHPRGHSIGAWQESSHTSSNGNATQALGSTHLLQSWWCLHCTWPTADCAHCQCFSKPVKQSLILFKPPKTVSTTRRNSLHLQQRRSWPARPLCREACQLWQVLCLSMPAAEETPLPPKQSVSWQSNMTLHYVLGLTYYSRLPRTAASRLHQRYQAACLLCDLLHVGADICGKLQSSAKSYAGRACQSSTPSLQVQPGRCSIRLDCSGCITRCRRPWQGL